MNPLSIPALMISLCLAQDSSQRVLAPVDATQAESKALAADTTLRIYDVSGVTGYDRLQEYVAGIVETANPVQVEGALARLGRLAGRRDEVRKTTDSLVATIHELITPRLEEGIQRVDPLQGGSLVLVGTREQHEWLAQFISAAAAFEWLIDVQAELFLLEKGGLEELAQVRSGEVLDAARTSALVTALEQIGATPVTSPRIAAYPFQEATLSVVEQVAYIKDYELKVLPEQDAEIADPVIDVVNSGVQMALRAVPLANDELSIFAKLEYSNLERPIRTVQTTLGAMGSPVTIQLPVVTRVKLGGRFEVLPGETLLLTTAGHVGMDNDVLVLLQATRIAIPEALQDADEDR